MKLYRKHLVKPQRLRKGQVIGIVAPACSFDPKNFKTGVDTIRDLGFKVKYDLMIFKEYWSMAGHDEQRARQINRMFADKEVKAIFCAQAGYGSMRTIPYLDEKTIRKNPKIFVGYSDITVLLSYLYNSAGMVVFHGPVVAGEMHKKMNRYTMDYLLRSIMRPGPLGEIKFPYIKTLREGRASGRLVGGNLSLIMSTIGTPYEIDTDGAMLFLEDIAEDIEVIDKHLMHLRMAGKFRKVKGIIFGRMLECIDFSGGKYTIHNVLEDILKDVKVPMIYGFPSGHRIAGDVNITLPFGVDVTVDAGKPAVTINESGVS